MDGGPSLEDEEHWVIHRDPPSFEEQSPAVEILETGIKVIDSPGALCKGRQDRTFRRCRCRKDRADPGIDFKISLQNTAATLFLLE